MNITQKIQNQISSFGVGQTFKYEQLAIEAGEYTAAAKAIERMIAKGVIKRVSAGVFYKPKKTIFGELKPNEEELLKPYLFENGKRIAYLTGPSLYNRMNLTTQIPKTIKIASRDKRITISRGNIKATPVKSYVDITNKNFYLLQILDVLKDFKKIPDLDDSLVIAILSKRLNELTASETKLLIKCALAYPPRVRSLLGALLDNINTVIDLSPLKNSLNPFSQYDYGIKSKLSTAEYWNIK